MNQISWDQYFIEIAKKVSERATCDRKHVGAVIVKDKRILCTGYNGSISKTDHCDQVGHMIENDHCIRTIHAEANAIIQAAKNGVNISNSVIYVTASPCWDCFKMIANAGIMTIFYNEFYRDEKMFEIAPKIGVKLCQI